MSGIKKRCKIQIEELSLICYGQQNKVFVDKSKKSFLFLL